MNKIIHFLILFTTVSNLNAQHLYKEKFENCIIEAFCLDCGTTKAVPPSTINEEIESTLNKSQFQKAVGIISAQILIYDSGKACLLSVDNATNVSTKKLGLQKAINNLSNWTPAITKDKKETSSVTLILEFNRGNLQTKRWVFDAKNATNMSSTAVSKVKGTDSDRLPHTWTLYNQSNSELPWDMTRGIAADIDNNIWIGTDNGIVEITQNSWKHYNATNTIIPPTPYNKDRMQGVRYAQIDHLNNKWFIIGSNVFKHNNGNWTKYDSINSLVKWPRKIILDHKQNVWFTSWDGIAKYDGKNWSKINKENFHLPSDKVLGLYVDRKDRMWIGTFEGNALIENGKTQILDDKNSPLSKAYISSVAEDNQGNMYFSLYNDKSYKDEGLFKLDSSNNWSKINFPKDITKLDRTYIGDFLIDEDHNELWITMSDVGILCYSIDSNKWQVYTNQNSNIKSTNAERIIKDKQGTIWVATYGGVAKLNR